MSQNNGPIFVVGSPRSGTTLLQYMLRSHPRISFPTGESHFFIRLYRNTSQFGDLSEIDNIHAVLDSIYRQSADFLDTDLHGLNFDIDALAKEFHAEKRFSIQSIVAGIFGKNAALEGKARWGDKTPFYVLHIPKLLAWFPNSQIIHLVRDGRDVALSLFGRKHDFGVYNTYFAAKYWQQYVEAGRTFGSELSDNTYLEIRYEDLLLDPKAAMRGICRFLGEDFSDLLINFKKSGEAGKTPLIQKPVQSSNSEKWRKLMTDRQIRVFESAAGNSLRRFGYPCVADAKQLPLLVRGGYRAHNHLFSRWRRLHDSLAMVN